LRRPRRKRPIAGVIQQKRHIFFFVQCVQVQKVCNSRIKAGVPHVDVKGNPYTPRRLGSKMTTIEGPPQPEVKAEATTHGLSRTTTGKWIFVNQQHCAQK